MAHDKDYAPSATELMVARDAALEALAWSTPATDGDSAEMLDSIGAEWHPSAIAAVARDLAAFIEHQSVDLDGLDYAQIGHDFTLTRNGHGTGFWDRGLGDRGDRLTAACKVYGGADAYVGDDGYLYIMGEES